MNQAKHILVTAPLGFGGITSMMINIQKNIDRDKLNFDYLVLHDRHEDLEDVVIKMGSQKLIASADEVNNKWRRVFVRWYLLQREKREEVSARRGIRLCPVGQPEGHRTFY